MKTVEYFLGVKEKGGVHGKHGEPSAHT